MSSPESQDWKKTLRQIQEKWRRKWEEEQTHCFRDDPSKPKYYVLDMFPYPSGAGLHIGHVKGYLATDIVARYKKMKGYSVLHPIGWDAFGLPAEQFALQNKSDPSVFTQQNISSFREELKSLFFSYDFEREIDSTDPSYYELTQWLFIQLYRRGLASREEKEVNWVEELHTVLANEEIYKGEDGKYYSERGNFPVSYKKLTQWVLKITEYAGQLERDLSLVDWPERIKTIQREWIGIQECFCLKLEILGHEFNYFESDLEKLRSLSGFYIYRNSKIYSLLKLKETPEDGSTLFHYSNSQLIYSLPVKFKEGEPPSAEELHPIYEELLSDKKLPYYLNWRLLPKVKRCKLQDWVFSRQRYWGEPIPMYYDPAGHIYIEEKLPLKLPPYLFRERGEGDSTPLDSYTEWVSERPGFRRDTNTMPNWAASSWYFLAYLLKKPGGYLHLESKEARELIERWMPVDLYIGGQEHATMHLIYARFWYKALHSILNLKTATEPFQYLVNQGMILGEDGRKMSKSRGNCLSISSLLQEWGGDEIRLSVAFLGPLELTQYWDDRQLQTFSSWLGKLYTYFQESSSSLKKGDSPSEETVSFLSRVEESIQSFKFNLLVSELMVFFKYLKGKEEKNYLEHKLFVQVLSLLAPALAEELWRECLRQEGPVYLSAWENIEKKESKVIRYSIQLNNRYKFNLDLPSNLKTEKEIFEAFQSREEFTKLLQGRELLRWIVIPGKVINLVTQLPS